MLHSVGNGLSKSESIKCASWFVSPAATNNMSHGSETVDVMQNATNQILYADLQYCIRSLPVCVSQSAHKWQSIGPKEESFRGRLFYRSRMEPDSHQCWKLLTTEYKYWFRVHKYACTHRICKYWCAYRIYKYWCTVHTEYLNTDILYKHMTNTAE